MEEEENTDRKQQLAMLREKLNEIKKYLNEDDTDNIDQVIASNAPESCLTYLMDLEKKGDPHLDRNHLTKLIDFYSRVFSSMPLAKHCENESYARMLVRFAELKGIQDVNAAVENFKVARSHCRNFALVHIAQAQFEHSRGNTKRGIHILQKGIEVGAKPKELLEAAVQNMQTGKTHQVYLEDKENTPLLPSTTVYSSVKKCSDLQKGSRISDGMGDMQLSSIFTPGMEPVGGSLMNDQQPGWRPGSHLKRAVGMPMRIPVVPFSIPENDDVDDYVSGKPSKTSNGANPTNISRQASGSNLNSVFRPQSTKKSAAEMDFPPLQPPVLSPEVCRKEDQTPADSTASFLLPHNAKDSFRIEDVTYNFNQVLGSNSPESCWMYLVNLEKGGNPHTNISLLNQLKRCYTKVFSRMPVGHHSKNLSYAQILVRYAQLTGIEDPDEAEDNFIVARTTQKTFAFVHVAHAQFLVNQGNRNKAYSVLEKGVSVKASPAELLDTAMRNLKAGEKQLVPAKEEEEPSKDLPTVVPVSATACAGNQEAQLPARVPVRRSAEQHKPAVKEAPAEWKIPTLVNRHVGPEEKSITPSEPKLVPFVAEPVPFASHQLPSRVNPPQSVCQTPKNYRNPPANSFITPVVKTVAELPASTHRSGRRLPQPCTPLGQQACFQTPKSSFTTLSNESITIKGKQFFILKMIGRGGSSKVYQVLDHKKQLFAVKYVDLEEADTQTVESYKNEIEHLNHLQQYSDQIIKLYDYEITNSYIYMLMECGNLDLNTWLRNRKTVNPLERKFYWKNMLEAVHTIHKHGIVHSDLKPANFVIVNASLKLIDFGIANRIQPDVTSIMKDSQVGTLNYMPPEAIKDTSSQAGKARSKISPKGDVWSLGCILYCMTYGKTPFQSITNQISKLHAIIDPSHKIDFLDISEKDLLDVLKRCLVRNPRERISIGELLEHPYLQLKPPASPEPERPSNSDLQKILNDLTALHSPNSIIQAAHKLAKSCSSMKKLDVAERAKSSS
ncbi:unnamed protein product [Ophioblennius macclurei]